MPITSESVEVWKAVAVGLQALADLAGVDDVAVVPQRQFAVVALQQQRLRVAGAGGAGRRVARMADGGVAAQGGHGTLVEDLGDEAHAGAKPQAVAVGRADAGALLPAMLQRVEAVEGEPRDVELGREDTEHTAGFPHLVAHESPRHEHLAKS